VLFRIRDVLSDAHDAITRLDIFIVHAKQCLFDIHIDRFIARLDSASHYSQTQQMNSLSRGRMQYSAASPTTTPPHPALMNAIYLLACHFAPQQTLAQLLSHIVPGSGSAASTPSTTSPPSAKGKEASPYESHFLSRALRGISASLEHADRLVDAVRASALLAVYFFAKARLLEGYYHASSAARLAVALGLHQIASEVRMPGQGASPPATINELLEDSTATQSHGSTPPLPVSMMDNNATPTALTSHTHSIPSASQSYPTQIHAMPIQQHQHQPCWTGVPAPTVPLPPPQDSAEHHERIAAFWQVFCVDRCWSVATGLPTSLPDDDHPQLRICTVWPRAVEEYSTVSYFCLIFVFVFPIALFLRRCRYRLSALPWSQAAGVFDVKH
jgi:hypothetical protein